MILDLKREYETRVSRILCTFRLEHSNLLDPILKMDRNLPPNNAPSLDALGRQSLNQ
jgi:hypothetical protein